MDKIDRKLLALFQQNTRQTTAELGERVGLSATSCQRRLAKLREIGVIEAEVAVLSPKAVGRPLTVVVEVILEKGQSDLVSRFRAFAASRAEISQCYYVTGRADFLLVMSMTNMEEYDEFTKAYFFDNPDVRSFETSVVMSRVKVSLAIPVL
ncbi:Lrp/AsnC family transcriptional regulator [Mesorhizobium sp.]|uniref:Lrp/AsnC family transcriptional regulator n=1 Tax=Mesorhizobium sp. TaxID=1871066 RepID=UPI0025F301D7|nr:Lrp/AsnC family transcriptional regulator [Mesorhizobium sp.]